LTTTRIVRVLFRRPAPLAEGFDRVEKYLIIRQVLAHGVESAGAIQRQLYSPPMVRNGHMVISALDESRAYGCGRRQARGPHTMPQNIYDQPHFFARYSELSRSVAGLEGAPEWPALRDMLPDLRGLRIIDLGCGFGWFCAWAQGQGAVRILGVDVSERMLERARATNAGRAISYERMDLERLKLANASFDLVYSSLAFHYIDDAARLVKTIFDALAAGGHLVFSIEHPIYMAPINPGWQTDASGRKIWPIDHYFVEGRRTTDWLAEGVVKHHRTIGTTLNLLLDAGFKLEHVEEFCPTPEQIATRPELAQELERPMFLLIAARR
jgi:SAM-dependent methyltransferase